MPASGTAAVSVTELAGSLGLQCSGDIDLRIAEVSSLPSATAADLCFIQSAQYLNQLCQSACGVVILPNGFDAQIPAPAKIWADNSYLAFVRAIEILHPDQVNRMARREAG